MKDKKEIKY